MDAPAWLGVAALVGLLWGARKLWLAFGAFAAACRAAAEPRDDFLAPPPARSPGARAWALERQAAAAHYGDGPGDDDLTPAQWETYAATARVLGLPTPVLAPPADANLAAALTARPAVKWDA